MQQGGDGFVLSSAILDDDSRDGQQVADVRNSRALARLISMQLMRENQGVFKALRESHSSSPGCDSILCLQRAPSPALAARREWRACRSSCLQGRTRQDPVPVVRRGLESSAGRRRSVRHSA